MKIIFDPIIIHSFKIIVNPLLRISSWCPVERENYIVDTINIIQNVGNFSIFIKNDVQFSLFGKKE
jgi:hypothetical protein